MTKYCWRPIRWTSWYCWWFPKKANQLRLKVKIPLFSPKISKKVSRISPRRKVVMAEFDHQQYHINMMKMMIFRTSGLVYKYMYIYIYVTVPWKVFLFHPIRVVLCVFCLRPLPSAKPEAPFLGFSPVVLLDEISQWALATSWKNRPVRNECFFFHLRFFTLRNPKRKGTIWSKILHDFLASRCLYHLPPRFIWFLQKNRKQKNIFAISSAHWSHFY